MTTRFIEHVLTGTHAARPAATAVPQGTVYACSTDSLLYQSSGSAWSTWFAPAAGATITTKEEGSTLSSTVSTLDFVGAGVTASGAGATTTITVAGLTYQMNQLSGNVALSGSPGTYVDGPSLVMAAGTYKFDAVLTIDGNDTQTEMTGKLWDGTTVAATSQALVYGGAAGRKYSSVVLTAVVVITGTPTWKVSVAGNGTSGNILAATGLYGAGNNASTLVAVRIA